MSKYSRKCSISCGHVDCFQITIEFRVRWIGSVQFVQRIRKFVSTLERSMEEEVEAIQFDRPETIHLTDYLEQDRFSIMRLWYRSAPSCVFIFAWSIHVTKIYLIYYLWKLGTWETFLFLFGERSGSRWPITIMGKSWEDLVLNRFAVDGFASSFFSRFGVPRIRRT